jgi:hypothetical protein
MNGISFVTLGGMISYICQPTAASANCSTGDALSKVHVATIRFVTEVERSSIK